MSLADIPSHIVQCGPKFPTGVENGPRTSSFPLEGILPPGLSTAIAHNGPLRRRIQDHCEESEEFKAHVRRAQGLLLGWLATLYHLILAVVRYALVCAVIVMSLRVDLTACFGGTQPAV